jgi:hypothetical protein
MKSPAQPMNAIAEVTSSLKQSPLRRGLLLLILSLSYSLLPTARAVDPPPDGDDSNSSMCVPPPTGLVSWWTGDRTAEDLQRTNPGALLNGALF